MAMGGGGALVCGEGRSTGGDRWYCATEESGVTERHVRWSRTCIRAVRVVRAVGNDRGVKGGGGTASRISSEPLLVSLKADSGISLDYDVCR